MKRGPTREPGLVAEWEPPLSDGGDADRSWETEDEAFLVVMRHVYGDTWSWHINERQGPGELSTSPASGQAAGLARTARICEAVLSILCSV
jgi:hypothetical protein